MKQIAYLGKLISTINRARDRWNWISNKPIHLIILSIYSNVKGYETKSKVYFVIKYEREKMAAASISALYWTKPHYRRDWVWWHNNLLWCLKRFALRTYLANDTANRVLISWNMRLLIFRSALCVDFSFLRQMLGFYATAPCS